MLEEVPTTTATTITTACHVSLHKAQLPVAVFVQPEYLDEATL